MDCGVDNVSQTTGVPPCPGDFLEGGRSPLGGGVGICTDAIAPSPLRYVDAIRQRFFKETEAGIIKRAPGARMEST